MRVARGIVVSGFECLRLSQSLKTRRQLQKVLASNGRLSHVVPAGRVEPASTLSSEGEPGDWRTVLRAHPPARAWTPLAFRPRVRRPCAPSPLASTRRAFRVGQRARSSPIARVEKRAPRDLRPSAFAMAVKVLRRISQETFDECVQGNIDDFEMEPDEAVEEAVKEFELQGVDLSQIHKSYAGPEGRGEHPAANATRDFVAAVEADPPNVTAAIAAGVSLRAEITGDDAVPGWGAACVRAGAVQAAARLCESVAAAREPDAASLTSALDTLARILAADEARDTYALLKLPRALVHTVWPACAAHEDDHAPAASACRVVAAASTRCEACKGAFVKASAEVPIVAVIRDRVDATALRAACDAARALTTGDDPRDPASGAFAHSRAMAKAGAASALTDALARLPAEENPALLAAVADTLKHTAVNDDICKEVAERGGLTRAFDLLRGCSGGDAGAARSTAALARQLLGSDANKAAATRAGGLAVLAHVVRAFDARAADADATDAEKRRCRAAQEQCVGALAAACLKNPEGAARLGPEGCVDAVFDAMTAAKSHRGLQRQCCMFARNAVVRNPENAPLLLAANAEALIRAAKRNHPKECTDVGSAALRDLGCDNYNEGYNPTTAVMGADGVIRTPEELGDEPLDAQARDAVRPIAGYGVAPRETDL